MSDFRELFQPSNDYTSALARAAELWGVQPDYWDIFGQRHFTTPEVQKAMLSSFGVRSESREELDAAVEERLWDEWSRLAPETLVQSVGLRGIEISVPAELNGGRLQVEFCWEDGRAHLTEHNPASLERQDTGRIRGRSFVKATLPLPEHAPLGYHVLNLTFDANGGTSQSSTRLILCPDRAWSAPELKNGGRTAGIAVSLYGLRSERNWGCGDFTDLTALVDWVADEHIADFVGLNPLHALANRMPYNTSPYLPICSFYRNPLYIDVERVPEFAASRSCRKLLANRSLQGRISELRASQYVEYEKVCQLKLKALKAAFREFLRGYRRGGERAQRFRDFVEREGVLLDQYAVYSALDEVQHKRNRNVWIWPDWPKEYHDPDSPATRAFAASHWRLVMFYKYMQWVLDEQLAEVQAHARQRGLSIGLYHDLALATDRFGSDLWAHRPFYIAGARVGAPPDSFSPEGQDWAFPPPNSIRHRENGYELFRESIRKNSRHGGALRIDHVMRFFRLFWIPDGKTAKDGAYVKEFSSDLLHILALESVRNRFMVVGEDLGTVEPYIREDLARFGVLSYRLLYFEKTRDEHFKRPAEYPRQALVSPTTHDLPTLAGFWSGEDIEARKKAGLLPNDDDYGAQLEQREIEKQRLLDLLHQLTLLPSYFPRQVSHVVEFSGELHNAIVGFLALTPSELMLINQEDLFKDPEQQNLPGSTEQYPNWRHKMRFTLEELRTNPFAQDCTAMLRNWIEMSGRAVKSGTA